MAVLTLLCWIYVRTHLLVFNESFWSHTHCALQVGGALRMYAQEHHGVYPGDHCHGPRRIWAPLRREVLLVDGRMQAILEKNWPAFANNQVELLVKAGFPRATAEAYYNVLPKQR